MKRLLTVRIATLSSLAFAAGLIASSSDATAQVKPNTKSKKISQAVVRGQNADNAVVRTSARASDEEIFDRDLSQVAAQLQGGCIPNTPNCTNMPGPQGPMTTPPADGQPVSPLPLPDQASPLTNPDSVLSPNPQQQQQQSQMPAPVTSLAAGQGASTAMSQVPAFMGDFFGGAPTTITPLFNGSNTSFLQGNSVNVSTTGGVGIMKLAENTSPLPRDRVFMSYNYFDNVNLAPGGVAVNRFTPGFEKTFFGGNTSVEVRVPMALTVGSNTSLTQTGSPVYSSNQYELGNLTTYFKALLYRNEQFALSTGLGVAAPTADDARVQDSTGNTVALISNQAWHLMPYVGSVYTPNDRFFAQTMLQVDFATNGNSVFTQNGVGNTGLTRDGDLRDPAYLFASLGTGYWIYQAADPTSHLSKISLISELHFNSTLQSTNVVRGTEVQTGSYQSQIQTMNAVFGTNIMLDQNKSLLLGYVTPLGSSDRAFAGEFRVLFNWYFGPYQNRATRVQF